MGNTFQKSMMSLMTGLMVDKEDIDPLREVFEAIDKDHDGTLTKEEIALMAEEYGDDKDGLISRVLGPKD